jgi:hypothetical protein
LLLLLFVEVIPSLLLQLYEEEHPVPDPGFIKPETDLFSDEEDGKGDADPDRLVPFPASGSTRQAMGVSKSMLCLTNKWLRMATMSLAAKLHNLQIFWWLFEFKAAEVKVEVKVSDPTCSVWKWAFMAIWRWNRFLQTGHWKHSWDLSFSLRAAAVNLTWFSKKRPPPAWSAAEEHPVPDPGFIKPETDLFSDQEDGKGDADPDRLLPFPAWFCKKRPPPLAWSATWSWCLSCISRLAYISLEAADEDDDDGDELWPRSGRRPAPLQKLVFFSSKIQKI